MRNLFKLKNSDNQRGVAALEFAIVLPLLLFLFLGITEFGIAYYNKQVVTNASREGARAGIVDGTSPQDIRSIAYNYAKDRLITFGADNFSDAENGSVTLDGCNASAEYCKVTVDFNYTYLILQGFRFFGAEFGPQLNIGASTTMRML